MAVATAAEVRALRRASARSGPSKPPSGDFRAGIVADAAGAWADRVAVLAVAAPIGLQPYRRTLMQLRVDPPAPAACPYRGIDALARFDFKPEAGGACGSARTTRRPATRATARPRSSTWRWRSTGSSGRCDWRWSGSSEAGRACAASPGPAPGLRLRPDVPGFFWCAGRAASQSRPPRRRRLAAALLLGGAGADRALARPLHELKRRVAGEPVGALVLGMAGMALDPAPVDLVRRARRRAAPATARHS